MDSTPAIIKLAVFAVGGQGGGVLSNWIVDVAERNGYRAQATSIAGVAQRTGATIYYVEMAEDTGRAPVFALAPSAGDVDILIAAELMESGRAMIRGLVGADTTLITSTHRMLAMSEKTVPGNGIADPAPVLAAGRTAAKRYIALDMEQIAVDAGSVVSASLFGALAASAALPFSRESYEATVRASGRGVEPSLRAFDGAFKAVTEETAEDNVPAAAPARQYTVAGPASQVRLWEQLEQRLAELPPTVRETAGAGCRKVADFQDAAYAGEYMDRLEDVVRRDSAHGGEHRRFALSVSCAKYVANAMVYDDVIRVADLKTRAARFARIREESAAGADGVVHVTEFMHPGAREVCGMLPAGLGRRIEASSRLFSLFDRLVSRGRRVRTDSVFWFSALYMVAGLRRWRRRLLRHSVEEAHLAAWLKAAFDGLEVNYDLAVEIVRCRRLVKGYSDTHSRALSKFDRVMAAAASFGARTDGPDQLHRLREAALSDEDGTSLDDALQRLDVVPAAPRDSLAV